MFITMTIFLLKPVWVLKWRFSIQVDDWSTRTPDTKFTSRFHSIPWRFAFISVYSADKYILIISSNIAHLSTTLDALHHDEEHDDPSQQKVAYNPPARDARLVDAGRRV